jgi:hypothetical protein
MSDDAAKSETAALRNLGRKIGIAGLATPDFDLVCANAHAVASFCDQFESNTKGALLLYAAHCRIA